MNTQDDKYLLSQRREILNLSYWEHFKAAKDLALTLWIKHPRYILYNIEVNKILEELHEIDKKLKIYDL